MAIYHHHVSLISRKAGRSATAAAAYRAGEKIEDTRTGEVHDYSRKSDVLSAEIIMPAGITWSPDRSELWNAVEHKNKRDNAQVAREFLIALPHELNAEQRAELARSYAQHLADTYQIAVDVALHRPGEVLNRETGELEGNGNWHAHLLTTTNRVTNDEAKRLGNKARELDPIASKRRIDKDEALKTGQPNAVERERVVWCDLTNAALERAGFDVRVDHRSNEARGLDSEPTMHLGPAAAEMERREPGSSRVGRENLERRERNLVRELMAQEVAEDEHQIWFIETELEALGDEREKLEVEIELKAERQAREAEIERQLAAEREREAERQAAEDAAAQAAADRDLEEIRAAQKAEAAARRERALERLQGVMPGMIRRTLEFMERYGIAPPESVRKALEARGYIEPPEKPEKPPERPLSSLEREFQQRQQQRDDHEDEHQGPRLG